MTIQQLETSWQNCRGGDVTPLIRDIRSAYLDGSVTKISLSGFIDGILGDSVTDDPGEMALYGRVIAAQMIILQETHSYAALRRRMLQFLYYASSTVRSDYDFARKAVEVLERNVRTLGYDWKTIEGSGTLDMLSYAVCGKLELGAKFSPAFSYTQAGQALLEDGILRIKSSPEADALARAFGVDGDMIQVFTKSVRTDKLKTSDVDDASALQRFSSVFAETQKESLRFKPADIDRTLKPGDKVSIKILSVSDLDGDGVYDEVRCGTLDGKHMIEGTLLLDEELNRKIYAGDLAQYLYEEDCIEDAVVVEGGDDPLFSLRDPYVGFALAKAKADEKRQTVFEAKVMRVITDLDRINWMTSGGYGAISKGIDGVKEGDVVVMTIQNIQNHGDDTYINICQPRYGYESVDRLFVEESVLDGFLVSVEDALGHIAQKENATKPDPAGKVAVRLLAGILGNVSPKADSLERYRRLLCAGYLADLIEDADLSASYKLKSRYLGCCLSYAQSGTAPRMPQDAGFTQRQMQVLSALSKAGEPQKIAQLDDIPALLYAQDISGRYGDEVQADPDGIRRRICEILGVADQFRAEDARVLGKYGRGEGQKLEFKASYVMRNDGKGPDLDYQGRGQVFEAVCAFLNADGGTVYIGVDDRTGNPIVAENSGLKGDMKWLTDNYSRINKERHSQLGHGVPKADTPDHMVQFLNSEKELYFRDSVLENITIEVTEDQDAIRITVRPSLYEIAVLYRDRSRAEGCAYMRDGGRTVPMKDRDKEQRLMTLKSIRKEIGFIVTLQDAIDRKHKVIFRDYASGNSGEISDRFVVPINLFYNDENVYCWDLEKKDYRQFRLSRIGSIDCDVDDPVYTHDFRPKQADVFRWIDDESDYRIKVRMEVAARNYLLEEYSNAKNLPASELYEDADGRWILDTHLHGLGAIRRFYLGLADKMEILPTEDSDKLKAEIKAYVAEHIAGMD